MRNGQTFLKYLFAGVVLASVMLPDTAPAQSVDDLLLLIDQGELDSAEAILTDLSFSNPGHPGIRYARALMQTDALVAAGIYKDIIRNHADSKYFPGSLMRLGEYYFAQGLYVQSRQNLMNLIRFYPESPHIVNAVNLSLRAGIASRQLDSVYIDLSEIVEKYPDLQFDIPEDLDVTRIPGRRQPLPVEEPVVSPLRTLGEPTEEATAQPTGGIALQAGAFGNYDNARRLADQIESIGYQTQVKERMVNDRKLFLVWVGDYPDREAAIRASDILEAALGVGTFPVAND